MCAYARNIYTRLFSLGACIVVGPRSYFSEEMMFLLLSLQKKKKKKISFVVIVNKSLPNFCLFVCLFVCRHLHLV